MTQRIATVLFFWACCAGVATAQNVRVNEDPAVERLVAAWTAANRSRGAIDGWRLQVMATTDRRQVEEAELRFKTLYPDVPAGWVHEKPYYKLRVGAFRNRQEAQAFASRLHTDFPGAYPARDPAIPPRDFLRP